MLGYSQSEIAAALKGIDVDGLALEEIIKQALKRMVKNYVGLKNALGERFIFIARIYVRMRK